MTKKKSKTKGKSSAGWIILVVVLLGTNMATAGYFLFLADNIPSADVPMDIDDLTANSEEYLGKTVTLSGYYLIAAGYPVLALHPLYLFNNSLDENNSVQLTGSIPESMDEYLGLPCRVKGVLGKENDTGVLQLDFTTYSAKEADPLFRGSFDDKLKDPYLEFDSISPILQPVPQKYAVLYSGGIRPDKAYSRYWNDIIYMYFILNMHGYEPENIYVIYKDGVAEDSYTPVDYPATHSSLTTVFSTLSGKMTSRDEFFFYTTNHGGSSGISVWNPMDSGGALTHAQVAGWLDSLSAKQMIIVMEQCVSGKFIPYISAVNRTILTACSDGESSYSCDDEGNWDEFVYHFMCALVGITWNGDGYEVDADYDSDGLISMREAFVWASAMDSRDETPLYDDNGDGVGYNVVETVFGGPMPGDSVFL